MSLGSLKALYSEKLSLGITGWVGWTDLEARLVSATRAAESVNTRSLATGGCTIRSMSVAVSLFRLLV